MGVRVRYLLYSERDNVRRWRSPYLGYHEWYEQLRMCDLVTGGKGSSTKGSFLRSREGDASRRCAFAIGMAEIWVPYIWEDQM